MRNQIGKNGEDPRSESRKGAPKKTHCEGETGRERKGRNRRLSSRKGSRSGRKKAEAERKMPEKKGTKGTGKEGKHLWNSCGSEAGKSEKKRTVEPSTGTWKESMRNQAGEKGETEEARAETGTGKAAVRRNREEKERKNRG